ncbi:MAG: peptidyl-prolyl cis-trans isomerase [Chloroflexi bacterium]|nr:peptidyl-prolyl cis-trans isomerase [Chloroflexota bacterium]
MTRRQVARWQRDRQRRRTITILGLAVIFLVLAIPLFGYYQTIIAPRRALVVRVYDTKFSMGHYVKLLRAQAAFSPTQLNLSTAPFELLQIMEDGELLFYGAPRLGVTVTREEIDRAIRNNMLPPLQEGEDPNSPQREREFQENYRQYLNATKLSEADQRALVERDLLQGKVREILGQRVPAVAEQVHLQALLVANQDTAQKALERLNQGEALAALTEELTPLQQPGEATPTDPLGIREKKGDLGWVPRRIFPQWDEVLFALEPGVWSDPVPTLEGFYLLQVVEKDPARAIDEENREVLKDIALEDWLLEERRIALEAEEMVRSFGSDKYEWAIRELQQLRQ